MSSTAHDTPAENIHINPLKHNSTKYLSSLGDKSGKADVMKAKRSADAEVSAECEPFTIGDEATKTFFSPGYPKEYTKNITCVRVIEGKWAAKSHVKIECCISQPFKKNSLIYDAENLQAFG